MGELAESWMLAKADDLLVNVFGYKAVQLGLSNCDLLRNNRIRGKVILTQDEIAALDKAPILEEQSTQAESEDNQDLPYQDALEEIYHDAADIPTAPDKQGSKHATSAMEHLDIESESVDLVVLPFTLDAHHNPHYLLREVERILVHEGRLLIFGFNPYSLWGLRNKLSRFPYLPIPNHQQIGLQKTKDWLQLLSFQIDRGELGCYEPARMSAKRLQRYQFMNKAGNRWWPFAGAIYYVSATKRAVSPKLVGPALNTKKQVALNPAPIAQKVALTEELK